MERYMAYKSYTYMPEQMNHRFCDSKFILNVAIFWVEISFVEYNMYMLVVLTSDQSQTYCYVRYFIVVLHKFMKFFFFFEWPSWICWIVCVCQNIVWKYFMLTWGTLLLIDGYCNCYTHYFHIFICLGIVNWGFGITICVKSHKISA